MSTTGGREEPARGGGPRPVGWLRAVAVVLLVVTAAWVLVPEPWRAGASDLLVAGTGTGAEDLAPPTATPSPSVSLVGTVEWVGPELAPPDAYLDDPALYDPRTPQEREAHLEDWGLLLARRQARGQETGTDVGTWCTLLGPSTTTTDLEACVRAWTEATATG